MALSQDESIYGGLEVKWDSQNYSHSVPFHDSETLK